MQVSDFASRHWSTATADEKLEMARAWNRLTLTELAKATTWEQSLRVYCNSSHRYELPVDYDGTDLNTGSRMAEAQWEAQALAAIAAATDLETLKELQDRLPVVSRPADVARARLAEFRTLLMVL